MFGPARFFKTWIMRNSPAQSKGPGNPNGLPGPLNVLRAGKTLRAAQWGAPRFVKMCAGV